MTKMQAYSYLQQNGLGFIANVVLIRKQEPAKYLKALAKLVSNGIVVDFAPFSMDHLLMNGQPTQWEYVLKRAHQLPSEK